ncbi:hypothetical protein [Flavobacterium sp. 3HN19-14]|uniref:hypothetical protein n=1 Tax=Flavobacterium sp. 3HN19-14 TaxID=3448133 RepID=UPI003EE2A6E9
MENYSKQDESNNWQDNKNPMQANDEERSSTGDYGLHREDAYDSTHASSDIPDDKERSNEKYAEDYNDENDEEEDDDDDDEATMDDWGDVDPAGGDAPSSPGSAV